ncbi:hypothetical protein [Paenibacillus senegalensis]|uniref:hypothetical protein n=1 Tax=Paenibacillus senegalensis TaxID=1465766 RepID=UPI001B30281C|nr:hypothetical protein [Paenibacillus senegalensis]
MYNQSFHKANYRGNQQGHDAYLRSDSQQPSSSMARNQMSNAQSQKFQPTGFVQSQYGQQQNQFQNAFANQSQAAFSFQNQQQNQQFSSAQSFHKANYRGNQAGHDSYLRSDSQSPSFRSAQSFQPQAQSFQSQAGISQQSFGQSQPQSYHTASYRGNQQGHDSYLRSDSQQPNQQAFGSQAANQASSSYHTASYRGNQQGHDSYLRSDSQNPAQGGFRG